MLNGHDKVQLAKPSQRFSRRRQLAISLLWDSLQGILRIPLHLHMSKLLRHSKTMTDVSGQTQRQDCFPPGFGGRTRGSWTPNATWQAQADRLYKFLRYKLLYAFPSPRRHSRHVYVSSLPKESPTPMSWPSNLRDLGLVWKKLPWVGMFFRGSFALWVGNRKTSEKLSKSLKAALLENE